MVLLLITDGQGKIWIQLFLRTVDTTTTLPLLYAANPGNWSIILSLRNIYTRKWCLSSSRALNHSSSSLPVRCGIRRQWLHPIRHRENKMTLEKAIVVGFSFKACFRDENLYCQNCVTCMFTNEKRIGINYIKPTLEMSPLSCRNPLT